jgi:Cu/Zn superoxide dismutase
MEDPFMRDAVRYLPRFGVALVTLGFAITSAVSADATCKKRMVALLQGIQEVPPNASTAVGSATIEVDTDANTLTYYISYGGLGSAETAAHIHGASEPGVAAPVIHGLPAGSPKVGVWVYPEALEEDILSGRTYINIHTVVFPGGEIRGQICTHVCDLDGAQEVPPNASAGRGFGVFTANTNSNKLKYYISYSGLGSAETAAHIHGVGGYGVAAGVKVGLPAGAIKTGVWEYPEADEPALLSGLMYVNIHSVGFPAGEIRGQMINHVVPMDGTKEVPPVPSAASGVGLISLDTATNELGFDIRRTAVTTAETAAHIHGFAPEGVAAGVLFGLPAGPRKLGTWAYAAAQEAGILADMTYINIHSSMWPGGEIRGQIKPPTAVLCPVDFNGDGKIDQSDLGELLAKYGKTKADPEYSVCIDLDRDGAIGQTDLGSLLAVYGSLCP